MGDFRRPRPNMGDKRSPKLPLDLTVYVVNCINSESTSTCCAFSVGLKRLLRTTFISMCCLEASLTRGITLNGNVISLVVRYLKTIDHKTNYISHSSIPLLIHTCTYMYIHVHTCTCMYTYMYMYMYIPLIFSLILLSTPTHSSSPPTHTSPFISHQQITPLHACMHLATGTYMHMYMLYISHFQRIFQTLTISPPSLSNMYTYFLFFLLL